MTDAGIRILLVEDDPELASELVRRLERESWIVDHLSCLADAFEAVVNIEYRAVLLDRGLPDGDGISLVPVIMSRTTRPPVIFLTAKDELDERITGLDSGAVDYIVKPFAFGELLARLRAACRRFGSGTGGLPRVSVGRLSFTPSTREAFIGNEPLALGRRELALLEVLVRRAGRVVLREQLDAEVYGIDSEVSTTAIETHISRLRKRLLDRDAGVDLRTIRGVGYILKQC
ncbi:MAG TPA: response regulator transcription factor [Allosphingosinicella sp.]|jgi:DNA-binding response OmpR family regulator|nr:response regulator transcription factor [Allosphingosinicella sp.]